MKRRLHQDAQEAALFGRMFPYGFPGDLVLRPRKREEETAVEQQNNFWLMCDDCQRWRLVRADLYERFAKLERFGCSSLHGTTCQDPDDWENVTKTTAGDSPVHVTLQPRGAADELDSPKRRTYQRRRPFVGKRKPNVFAGSAIPGFAAALTEGGPPDD